MRHTDTSPGWIARELRDIRRQLREDRAAKRLTSSAIETGTLTVTGDALLDVQSRINIPPGSIPASWLQAPAAPGFVSLTAAGFGVGTTSAYLIDSTVTVPVGFSACVVSLTGRVYAANDTAGEVALFGQVEVAGVTGNALPVPVAASGYEVNVATFAAVFTDLTPTATFPLRLAAWASAALATAGGNTADLTGSVVWFA